MKSSTVLKQLIDEIQADPNIRIKDDQIIIINELCTKIQQEEDDKLDEEKRKYLNENAPKGSNIFLTLSIPYQRSPKEVSYLTLENDALFGWSACYYVDFGSTGKNKLKSRHDIEAENPNHIMTSFAIIYKKYLGKKL